MTAEQEYESKALVALRQAVAKALDRKRRLGQYAVVWRDGRPVRIGPDAIGVTEKYGGEHSASVSTLREPGPSGSGNGEGS